MMAGSIKILKWSQDNRCLYGNDVWIKAAAGGNLELLKYVFNTNYDHKYLFHPNNCMVVLGLTLSKAKSGNSLYVSTQGLSNVTTSSFDVFYPLVVTTPPPGPVTAGTPFGLAVSVKNRLWKRGHIVQRESHALPVQLCPAAPPDTLRGMLTVAAVHGVATFSRADAGPGWHIWADAQR